jgi:hypothetical protein
MAEEKMAGKVNDQRSDQWFVGGFTTILVSGLLTISWRVYTVGKIPFWSAWPGILGVVPPRHPSSPLRIVASVL